MYSNHKIIEDLAAFGISPEAALLYIELVSLGQVGVMELTRKSGIGRNVVYKLLDELTKHGLVSVAEKSYGKVYRAKQGEAFEAIIESRSAQVESMRSKLEGVAQGLLALSGEAKASSKIVHFEGLEGLEQVNWNLTKATKEFRVYEQSHVDEYLSPSFAKKLRVRYAERNLTSYDLTNKKKIDSYTDQESQSYWQHNAHYRYIHPRQLAIHFEMYIYDDVTTLLDYHSDKPHCIEIHNQALASMQKQIFDIVWKQASPMQHNKGKSMIIVK